MKMKVIFLYWESLSIRLPDRPLILGVVIDKATDRPLILGVVIDKATRQTPYTGNRYR